MWDLLGSCGTYWGFAEFLCDLFGICWDLVELIKDLLNSCGSFWDPLEFVGILWDLLGSCGI